MTEFLRSFRSGFAGLLFLLGIGIGLLWPITSNRNFELFNNVTEWELYCAESWNGKMRISHSVNSGKTNQLNVWRFWSLSERRLYSDYGQYAKEWNSSWFEAKWNQDEVSLALPLWLWAAFVFVLAYLLKPAPKLQFTFQDLLMMIAVFAVMVGSFTLSNNFDSAGL